MLFAPATVLDHSTCSRAGVDRRTDTLWAVGDPPVSLHVLGVLCAWMDEVNAATAGRVGVAAVDIERDMPSSSPFQLPSRILLEMADVIAREVTEQGLEVMSVHIELMPCRRSGVSASIAIPRLPDTPFRTLRQPGKHRVVEAIAALLQPYVAWLGGIKALVLEVDPGTPTAHQRAAAARASAGGIDGAVRQGSVR